MASIVRVSPGCNQGSFFSPAGGGFPLAFANPVTVAFDHRHVGMVQQTVQQSHDASGVRKDLVPLFERSIGREDRRFSLVARGDDLIEEVGGLLIEG